MITDTSYNSPSYNTTKRLYSKDKETCNMQADQGKVIEQYLNIESNYAVIINGEYGIGKTHFFKEVLIPTIKKIKLPANAKKHYRPVHISLFGLRTLAEIETAILAELYPLLKDKKVKLATGLIKALIRGYVKLKTAGAADLNVNDYTEEVKGVDWINFDELVICFDDLDRKSAALDVRDVFGFINSLVENQGVKIIIIANEKQLKKDNEKHYLPALREKVIGVTIQYTPQTEATYNSIIDSKYSSTESEYHKFLQDNAEIIIKTIKNNNDNLRNLVFFLEHFKVIFKELQVQFGFANEPDFKVAIGEKQRAVMMFTLAFSIEYKMGRLHSGNFDDIITLGRVRSFISLSDIGNISAKNEKEAKPNYSEKFRNKYFKKGEPYYHFKAIADYLTGVTAFDISKLRKELENYFVVENGSVPIHIATLQKLSYDKFLSLSDKEYRNLTMSILKFADKGLYTLQDYTTIFHYAVRFGNHLDLDIDNTIIRIKKGIDRGINKYQFIPNLDFYLTLSNDMEYKEESLQIAQHSIEKNEEVNQNEIKLRVSELESLFSKDNAKFISSTSDNNNDMRYISFFKNFNLKRTYNAILKLSNDELWHLANYFNKRYKRHMLQELRTDKNFCVELLGLIDKPTKKRTAKSLRNLSLDRLSNALKTIIPNFDA